jgi:dTDP-4-dehydrorhamnose 3,5-epimerase-like enzyme
MSVELMKVEVGGHSDQRRTIADIILPPLPFSVVQVKVIDFTVQSVMERLAVGNHYHTKKSERAEFFVATGPVGKSLFMFAHLENGGDGNRQIVQMQHGDACLVLPESVHAFVPLVADAVLWGFSNKPYDPSHDVRYPLL